MKSDNHFKRLKYLVLSVVVLLVFIAVIPSKSEGDVKVNVLQENSRNNLSQNHEDGLSKDKSTDSIPEDKAVDRIPDIYLQSEIHGNITPDDLKDKVVLISLFATWCPPCQLELSDIEKILYPKYRNNDNFKLLVIGREHTDADLKKYNQQKNFSFPLYPDPDRKVFSLFADKSIPRMYLFNRQGILVFSSMGYAKEEFNELMNKIDECLK